MKTTAPLPESWQPPKEVGAKVVVPELIEVPACDFSDAGQLFAWFGNFGVAPDYRKAVLSGCEEVIRAKFTLAGQSVTEHRLDVLAHQHDAYLAFLQFCLDGRRAYDHAARHVGFPG